MESIALCKPLFIKKIVSTPEEWMCGASNEVFCSKNLISMEGIEIFNWK